MNEFSAKTNKFSVFYGTKSTHTHMSESFCCGRSIYITKLDPLQSPKPKSIHTRITLKYKKKSYLKLIELTVTLHLIANPAGNIRYKLRSLNPYKETGKKCECVEKQ